MNDVLDEAAKALGQVWLDELHEDARSRVGEHRQLAEAVARDAANVYLRASVARLTGDISDDLRKAVAELNVQAQGLAIAARADLRGALAAAMTKTLKLTDNVAAWVIRKVLTGGVL